MNRRKFVAFLLSLAAGLITLLASPPRKWLWSTLHSVLAPRLDPRSGTGSLSDREMASVIAFAEVLVEGRVLSPSARGHLRDHVETRTRSAPGYAELYRVVATRLDQLAGEPFGSLDVEHRVAIMTSHRLTSAEVRLREHLQFYRRDLVAIRALAVPDLIRGYYESPAGWALVGYAAFPGRCGDLFRYTRPEGAA